MKDVDYESLKKDIEEKEKELSEYTRIDKFKPVNLVFLTFTRTRTVPLR